MIGLQLQAAAEIWAVRVLNSLPAGMLVALFAWTVLRVLRGQNSGTRFAVWFVALLTIAGLPLMGSFRGGQSWLPAGAWLGAGIVRAPITLPTGWALYLFLGWFVVAFLALARLTVGLWRLRVLRKSCVAINAASLEGSVQKTISAFSASRSVTIATSEAVRVPAAIGFWNPMIAGMIGPTWCRRQCGLCSFFILRCGGLKTGCRSRGKWLATTRCWLRWAILADTRVVWSRCWKEALRTADGRWRRLSFTERTRLL